MNTAQRLATATAVTFILAIGAAGKDEPTRRSSYANPDRGMLVFNAYCVGCHGDEGRGDGPMAPRLMRDFQVLPTDFSNPAWQQSRDDASLKRVIRKGGAAAHRTQFMPAWGLTLSEAQVDDLVSFIRDLPNPGRQLNPRVSVLDVQQQLEVGRTLYGLYCIACHGRYGQGDGPLVDVASKEGILAKRPPDFSQGALQGLSDDDLHAAVQGSPAHAHLEIEHEESSWWHRPLSDSEVDSLAFYLRAQALVHKKPKLPAK